MVSRLVALKKYEHNVIIWIQKNGSRIPGFSQYAKLMSLWGEHAVGWLSLGALMWLKERDKKWAKFSYATLSAHALSIGIKYILRRPRPQSEQISSAATAGKYSFPSSHLTSTTVAVSFLTNNNKFFGMFVPAMGLARLFRGVHYPSDIIGGIIVGGLWSFLLRNLKVFTVLARFFHD